MLWLVTPVFGRLELTRIVFEQRARMLEELDSLGVPARQLVVGDDANLDTAREFGFNVLERPNVLGLRVNEGFEWACREGGASHVAYCGSDDWHLAEFFTDLDSIASARTSAWQAFMEPTGRRLVAVRGLSSYGHAPWVVARTLLEPCGFRPSDDEAMHGIDGSIANGVADGLAGPMPRDHNARVAWRQHRKRIVRETFQEVPADWLRMVDFKGGGEQITPYRRVIPRGVGRETVESEAPFDTLATRYPADLVERMQRFYVDKETPR